MAVSLAVVYRNLAALHRSGLSWPEAVASASGTGPAWVEARASLARGEPVSRALAGAVPPLDVAALRAAEASGRFEEVLTALSARHEEETRRTRERRSTLAYPVVLAHLGAALLPVPDLVQGHGARGLLWALLILVPVYAWLAYSVAARRAVDRDPDALDRGFLARFKSRAFVEEADARALGALGWLHDAGVPFDEAVRLAARAGAGGRAARDLRDAEAGLRDGRPLSASWRAIPEEARLALTTGERTGSLSAACEAAAADLDERARARRRRFLALAPVGLLLAIGLVIAWRVIAYYAGVFELANRLR
jgi:type IV pilus assembly protein PilC